ncbi:hypothetical protein HDU76_001260, partial [Blyttiomyces sp. JEL0837]
INTVTATPSNNTSNIPSSTLTGLRDSIRLQRRFLLRSSKFGSDKKVLSERSSTLGIGLGNEATESENAITGHIESPSRSASEFNEAFGISGLFGGGDCYVGGGNGIEARQGKSGRGCPRGVNVDANGGGGYIDDGQSHNEDENGMCSLNETAQLLPNLELDHVKVVEENGILKNQGGEKELLHLEVRRLECQLVNLQEELERERTKVALLESGGDPVVQLNFIHSNISDQLDKSRCF